jgi:hypothetical protein
VCVSHPSPEDGNRSSFRNVVFLEYLKMDKVQKPSNPKCYNPSSEPFRINGKFDFQLASTDSCNTKCHENHQFCHEVARQAKETNADIQRHSGYDFNLPGVFATKCYKNAPTRFVIFYKMNKERRKQMRQNCYTSECEI